MLWGDEFAADRGKSVAELYSADSTWIPGAGHWDLVMNNDVRDVVGHWIASTTLN